MQQTVVGSRIRLSFEKYSDKKKPGECRAFCVQRFLEAQTYRKTVSAWLKNELVCEQA